MAGPLIESSARVAPVNTPGDSRKTEGSGAAAGFEKLLNETAQQIKKADNAILESNTGGSADLHDVMIAMEKADISLKLLVQVRNKAVDAYQEIMRMQV